MLGGDFFTSSERQAIERAVSEGEDICGYAISVHVGPSDGDPRQTAERMHRALGDPARSILVHVDPTGRALEIVTGTIVRSTLDNGRAGLAAVTMQSAVSAGALAHGIVGGVQQLARAARHESPLHTDTP